MRRTCISGLAILSAIALQADAGATAGQVFDRTYTVYRDGREIGSRIARITRDGGRLEVVQETDIAVNLLFFTLFERQETLREIWANGRLIRFTSNVNNDGKRFAVNAVRTESGALHVTGAAGTYRAPEGALPATYWHRRIIRTATLIHVMRGTLQRIETRRVGEEILTKGGDRLKTTHYRVTGDERADLWFDAHGVAVRVVYYDDDDGSEIEFYSEVLSDMPVDPFAPND